MCASKIEKLNLQTQFLPIYHKTNGNVLETSRLLTQLAGETISNMAVKRYLKKLDVIDEVKNVKESKTEAMKIIWMEEKENIINAYQAVIQKALIPLKNAKDDESILKAVPVAMHALQRALNHHSIGMNKSETQVNIQVNFIQDRIKEIAKIISEECNGSSERVIERLELLSNSN